MVGTVSKWTDLAMAVNNLEQHYTVQDVAAAWKTDERTIRSMIAAGKLRAVKVGRQYRIPASAVEGKHE